MTVTLATDIPRSHLDMALQRSPAHMRPVILAVRDGGVAWATILQRSGRFDLPVGRPVLAIVGDDTHTALGPAGFHRKSMRRLIASCRLVSIVACEPVPLAYAAAAGAAVGFGVNAAIIETRPDQELRWHELVKAEAPNAQVILASVKERGH